MTGHRAKRPSGRRGGVLRSARLRAALSLGVVLSVASTGTFAFWTDSAQVTGGSITGGTIDLQLKDGTGVSPGFVESVTDYATIDLANMVPGNSVAAVLTVKNNGTAPLTFVASSTAVNTPLAKDLASAMVVKVTAASAVTGSAPARTCGGTALTGSGTTLNASLIGTAIELASLATTTVCVQITLNSGASTTLQGATADITLAFTGTQKLT